MRTRGSSNKTYHHGDLKNALVEAAAKLIAERGAAAVSLREVAREAGVSHAAPYHHFKDKSGLLASVAEEGFRRFDQSQERALRDAPSDPKERLKALGKSYVRFALSNPHFFRVMFRDDLTKSDQYPSLSAVASRTFNRLVDVARENRRPPEGSQVLPSAIRTWAFVHGLATLLLDGSLNKIGIDRKILEALVDPISI